MPKGMAVDREAITSAVKLRGMIRQLEVGLADLRGQGRAVFELLRLRDRVAEEVASLREEGVPLRPEETRLETVDGILTRKTSAMVWELRSMGGLAGARRVEKPPEERWWWYLDLYQAERQRKTVLRTAIIIASVVALVLVVNLVLDRFFGLSPQEKAARNYTGVGEQYLARGDVDRAIAEYERGVAVLPSMGDAQVMLGTLYELRGKGDDAQKARAAFSAAEATHTDRVEYLLTRARAYESVGQLDKALARANDALALAPESAQAYLMRGGIYESQGDLSHAYTDYERSAELAQAQGQDTIYVLAKMRLGMLMQRGPGTPPTPTP